MDDKVRKHRRDSGLGSTYLSGGKWYFQWTDPVTHKTRALSSGSTDRAVAESKLLDMRTRVGKGESDPGAVDKQRMKGLFADLELDYEVNGFATLADCESRVRLHLLPFFGGMRAVRVRNTHAQAYILMRREEGASDSTIANELGLLRRAFNLAVENGKLSVAPFVGLPAGYDVPRQGFLEPAQYRTLMLHLNENLRPLVCLAFFTGMRRGELLSLKWSQVDLVEGTIRLSAADTKTRQARTIPVAAEPLAMLRVSKVRRDQVDPTCDAVFYRARRRNVDGAGGPLAPLGDFRIDWMQACCAAKLGEMVGPEGKQTYRGLIFHDLRRSGVRQLIRSGVDEHTAMRISGHLTRSIFARYDIVSLDDLRAATKKLDAHLALPAPEQQASVPEPEQQAAVPTRARIN
jgi:integrase